MKIKVLSIVAVVLGFAAASYATDISTGTSLGSTNTPFRPSSKVTFLAIATTSNYAATGQHSSAIGNSAKGGFQYGTLDSSASLLRAPATAAGTTAPTAPSSATALDAAFTAF